MFVCGDIHGEFKTLIFNIKRLGIKNSVIIVAGDCGIGFEKEAYYAQLYNKLRITLNATNNMLLLIRGNHDDPAYFNENRIDFERMKCISDYSIVNTTNNTTLCIGGAISIDRNLADDLRQERTVMDQIYEHIIKDCHPLKRWFYGHFHQSHSEHFNLINFTLLDIMEIKEVAISISNT